MTTIHRRDILAFTGLGSQYLSAWGLVPLKGTVYDRKQVLSKLVEVGFLEEGQDVPSQPKGYVYVIKCESFFKVGKAENPKRRFMELQLANPFRLRLLASFPTETPEQDEKAIHAALKSHWIRGEWFSLSETSRKDLCAQLIKLYGQSIAP